MKQNAYQFITSYKNGRTTSTLIFAFSVADAIIYCEQKYSIRTLKRSALFFNAKLVHDFDD